MLHWKQGLLYDKARFKKEKERKKEKKKKRSSGSEDIK